MNELILAIPAVAVIMWLITNQSSSQSSIDIEKFIDSMSQRERDMQTEIERLKEQVNQLQQVVVLMSERLRANNIDTADIKMPNRKDGGVTLNIDNVTGDIDIGDITGRDKRRGF